MPCSNGDAAFIPNAAHTSVALCPLAPISLFWSSGKKKEHGASSHEKEGRREKVEAATHCGTIPRPTWIGLKCGNVGQARIAKEGEAIAVVTVGQEASPPALNFTLPLGWAIPGLP